MTMARIVHKSTWRRTIIPLAVALVIMGLASLALWQDVWAGGAPVKEKQITHTVQAGDSLFALAREYHVNLDALAAANELETNSILFKNQVLIIPPAGSTAPEVSAAVANADREETGEATGSIITAIQASDGFNTLLSAIEAAGLAGTLQEEGPFTIFAPTDAAFDELPDGTIDGLLAGPEQKLAQILAYHIMPGRILAADIEDGATANTLQGGEVVFTVGKGGALINGANIVATDMEGSNGVIHVINSVLTPPADGDIAGESVTSSAGSATQSTGEPNQSSASRNDTPRPPKTYMVEAGDSFFALAREFGVSQEVLAAANDLAPNAILYKRQVLVIPADDEPPAMTAQEPVAQETAAPEETDTPQDATAADADQDQTMGGDDERAGGDMAGDMADEAAEEDAADEDPADAALADEEMAGDAEAAEESADDEQTVEDGQRSDEVGDIIAVAQEAGDLEILLTALEAAELTDELREEGPFTLFAPTDAVFETLPQNVLDTLLANSADVLDEILRYHILPGRLMAEEITDGLAVETLQGSELSFTLTSEGTMVNGVPIVLKDIEAGNGLIHVIDAILIPTGSVQPTSTPKPDAEEAKEAGEDDGAEDEGVEAEVEKITTPEPTPAPTDTPAEEKAGETRDTESEMDGEDGMAEGRAEDGAAKDGDSDEREADVEEADVEEPDTSETGEPEAGETETEAISAEPDDIIATAETAGEFDTLLAALKVTDLVDELQGEGPFTLFAPTDAAFAALPAETLATLLDDPEGDLTQILLYHVAPGRIMAADMRDGFSVESLQGSELTFGTGEDNPTVDGVDIVLANIETSNGVIHVIDVVLSPPTAG